MGGGNFKYIIVGSGNFEEKLKQETAELGLENEVIFAGKIMDREFLSAVYLRADLLIFPSTFDTASLAPVEAAAMKLPTIMTKGCSSAEIITDKVNGLVAEETVDAWATTILESIKNKTLPKLREPAHREVYRTWDDVICEMMKYYQQVAASDKEVSLKT